jgi:hypothetical protein
MMMRNHHALLAAVLALAGCGSQPEAASPPAAAPAAVPAPAVEAPAVVTIPASLAPFGDGYPLTGDPCRLLGESELTSNFLDDSAELVGCPTKATAAALGGRVVATIDGVTLVSIPSQHGMSYRPQPD